MSEITEIDVQRIAYLVHQYWDSSATTAPHHAQAHTLTGSDHTASGLTTGTFLEATGATAFGFVARYLKVLRTADSSDITSATLADDGVITVSLAASSNYDFRLNGFITNGGTEGVKLAMNGTVGVTALKAQIIIYDDSSNAIATMGRVTALGSSVGVDLVAGVHFFEIKGTIETSTAGTLLLQTAVNSVTPSALIVQRGTSMQAMRLS